MGASVTLKGKSEHYSYNIFIFSIGDFVLKTWDVRQISLATALGIASTFFNYPLTCYNKVSKVSQM